MKSDSEGYFNSAGEIACRADGCWKTAITGGDYCVHHAASGNGNGTYRPLSAAQREAQRVAYVEAVNQHSTLLIAHTQAIDSLLKRLAALERQHAACERRIDKDEQAVAAKLNRFESSLLARLRWLVLGR